MNPALAVDPELPRRRLDVDEYHRMGEAVTPDRLPPGVLGAWMRSREPKGANGKRPPAILESTRWVEGHERACEQASTMPDTRLVYVADREADMGELLTRGAHLGWPTDMLVRSSHDRALPEEGGRLWAAVLGSEPLGGINFTLAARPSRGQVPSGPPGAVRPARVDPHGALEEERRGDDVFDRPRGRRAAGHETDRVAAADEPHD